MPVPSRQTLEGLKLGPKHLVSPLAKPKVQGSAHNKAHYVYLQTQQHPARNNVRSRKRPGCMHY